MLGIILANETHERLSEIDEAKPGSERSFGLTFSAVFLIISLFPLLHLHLPRLWPLPIAAAFAAVGLLRPSWLAAPNKLWFKFGMLLHKIMNPLILGLLFFIVITPTAYAVRLMSGRMLGLSYDEAAPTYWISRTPPGPDNESIRNQF